MTKRRSVLQRLALLGAIVTGLAVTGAVLGALVRLPESSGPVRLGRVDGPPAPLTGGSAAPSPAAVTPVRALAASTPVAAPAPPPVTSASPTPPAVAVVRITAPVETVSVPAGAELAVDLAGTAAAPWNPPSDSTPTVLRPLSIDAEPLALHALYLATRPGTAVLELDRLAVCISAASAGVCPAQAFRVTVTVTAR